MITVIFVTSLSILIQVSYQIVLGTIEEPQLIRLRIHMAVGGVAGLTVVPVRCDDRRWLRSFLPFVGIIASTHVYACVCVWFLVLSFPLIRQWLDPLYLVPCTDWRMGASGVRTSICASRGSFPWWMMTDDLSIPVLVVPVRLIIHDACLWVLVPRHVELQLSWQLSLTGWTEAEGWSTKFPLMTYSLINHRRTAAQVVYK